MNEETPAVDVPPIPAPLEATAKVVETEAADEMEVFVSATTLEEMNVAQKKLQSWAERKVEKSKAEIDAAIENLNIAKQRKWGTKQFDSIVLKARKNKEFYEKVAAALKAGYTIIPDMPMDVFAIRTTAKNPRKNRRTSRGVMATTPWLPAQETNNPPLGEGRFVSPQAGVDVVQSEELAKDGKMVTTVEAWADEFKENIDFPFKLARPMVLEATAKALSEKFFDELGAAPSKNRGRRGDPMVIGHIFVKHGWTTKGISFLVSWFIDSKDL